MPPAIPPVTPVPAVKVPFTVVVEVPAVEPIIIVVVLPARPPVPILIAFVEAEAVAPACILVV